MGKTFWIVFITAGTMMVLYSIFAGAEEVKTPVGSLPTLDALKKGLKKVKDTFGEDTARNVEKMFRLETRHFESDGMKNTNMAGMIAAGLSYPYGWSSVRPFWDNNKKYVPTGTTVMKDVGIGLKPFIVFPSFESGAMTLAYWLQTHKPGRWNSLLPEKQKEYEAKLAQIKAPITDSI